MIASSSLGKATLARFGEAEESIQEPETSCGIAAVECSKSCELAQVLTMTGRTFCGEEGGRLG